MNTFILVAILAGATSALRAADAPALKKPTKVTDTNWIYTAVTNIVGGDLDPRFGELMRTDWQIHSYQDESAWVGGANRPARHIIHFRKRPK
jgi:ABC-type Zn uptake system ZnuABC Zn-binding protein ZnuA